MDKESDEGNIEYKLLLDKLTEEKAERLAAQMLYRLNEGHGEAFYIVGLSDDGQPIGLSDQELSNSLNNLKIIAQKAGANIQIIRTVMGEKGAIAEVYVRRIRNYPPVEVSVALLGNVDAGKSTLKGVLTFSTLDNGNGYAMSLVARYLHEIKMRRTSSVSVHIIGYDSEGRLVNDILQNYNESEIYLKSNKIIYLIDLAGHEKYFKTTLKGIMGNLPDYNILVVSLSSGPIGTFKEHLGISVALKIPIIIVFTKVDMAPKPVAEMSINEVIKMLKMPGIDKIPFMVKDESDLIVASKNIANGRIVPIFIVSNKTGEGIDLLKKFMNFLPKRINWEERRKENEELFIGPMADGSFKKVNAFSIYKNRVPVNSAYAGEYVTIALNRVSPEEIKSGMILTNDLRSVKVVWKFKADIRVLHHPTLIKIGYEPVIQLNTIKEVAKIISSQPPFLKTGEFGSVVFQLKYRPIVINEGDTFIFREGKARGIGKITGILN
jgi:elongation factor 1-alpha